VLSRCDFDLAEARRIVQDHVPVRRGLEPRKGTGRLVLELQLVLAVRSEDDAPVALLVLKAELMVTGRDDDPVGRLLLGGDVLAIPEEPDDERVIEVAVLERDQALVADLGHEQLAALAAAEWRRDRRPGRAQVVLDRAVLDLDATLVHVHGVHEGGDDAHAPAHAASNGRSRRAVNFVT
jgi:hypothetical protein